MKINIASQNKTRLVRIDEEVLKKLNDLGTNEYKLVFPSPNMVLRIMLGLKIKERSLISSKPKVRRTAGGRPMTS